jgi:hypothetical protein
MEYDLCMKTAHKLSKPVASLGQGWTITFIVGLNAANALQSDRRRWEVKIEIIYQNNVNKNMPINYSHWLNMPYRGITKYKVSLALRPFSDLLCVPI